MRVSKLFEGPPDTLIKLAGFIWYTGVIVLLFKSGSIFLEAAGKGASVTLICAAVSAGLCLGAIKSKYLFIRVCIKNIKRIYALESPKLWQCYRSRFFFFLFCMILSGNYGYVLARDNVYLLLSLAMLELSVATALLISSRCFHNVTPSSR